MQAPHSAMPQPNFVPVMPSTSRNTHKSGVSPSTSTVRSTPLILIVVAMSTSRLFAWIGYAYESNPGCSQPGGSEALAAAHQTGEHFFEPELHRLMGKLRLEEVRLDVSEVENSFVRALDVARRQQAKSLELRAAASLARLWGEQGRRGEARDLLAPVYGWFTEGFDTTDLKDAKALLDELR
jgi:hypothetical protein